MFKELYREASPSTGLGEIAAQSEYGEEKKRRKYSKLLDGLGMRPGSRRRKKEKLAKRILGNLHWTAGFGPHIKKVGAMNTLPEEGKAK